MMFFQKFSLPFSLAITMHLVILALFAIGINSETERVRQKPLPEIIQATMLDDVKIQKEANRLKENEENNKRIQIKKQQALENNRKKEQNLLKIAKKKRLAQEKQAKKLAKKRAREEKKRTELLLKVEQKLKKIKQEKALEAAQLAKIKQQQKAEKQRLDDLRVAKEKKLEQDRIAEQQRQQALIAQQKAKAIAAKVKSEQNKHATHSATVAIQLKVNQRWIKPISSRQGLKCTIRVKLLPSGDVMDAVVIKSSGDIIFDRSAENAVRKASPLPVPQDRALFSQQFRSFTFEFKPE